MPKGIESWAPIVIGARMLEAFMDKYKNILTITPKQIENPIKGIIYFLSIIWNLKNGIKHKNTINILKPPKRIGGIVSFNPNLPVGYALPSRNTTNKISNVCFVDNYYLIEKGSKVGSSKGADGEINL